VTTSDQYADEDQAYAAGFIEGQMTKELIQMFWHNTIAGRLTLPQCSTEPFSIGRSLQDFLILDKNNKHLKLSRSKEDLNF